MRATFCIHWKNLLSLAFYSKDEKLQMLVINQCMTFCLKRLNQFRQTSFIDIKMNFQIISLLKMADIVAEIMGISTLEGHYRFNHCENFKVLQLLLLLNFKYMWSIFEDFQL